jgi:hypothetical protein
MASTQSTEQILKSDVQGRVRVAPTRREELLDEFENSGVSARSQHRSCLGAIPETGGIYVNSSQKALGVTHTVLDLSDPSLQGIQKTILLSFYVELACADLGANIGSSSVAWCWAMVSLTHLWVGESLL